LAGSVVIVPDYDTGGVQDNVFRTPIFLRSNFWCICLDVTKMAVDRCFKLGPRREDWLSCEVPWRLVEQKLWEGQSHWSLSTAELLINATGAGTESRSPAPYQRRQHCIPGRRNGITPRRHGIKVIRPMPALAVN
jgi:hypothetical protein